MASNASMTEMEILFPIISSTGLTHDLAGMFNPVEAPKILSQDQICLSS